MTAVAASTRLAGVDAHCEGVVQIYAMPDGDVVALRGVDLDIDAGEALALLGPSGSGKSTLLALLGGLIKPSAGTVRVGAFDLGRLGPRELIEFRSSEVAISMQSPSFNLLPYATVVDNVRFAQSGSPVDRREEMPKPEYLLSQLGLSAVAGQSVATLSGGQQRLASLAVGIARLPRMLLVDEPTSDLDPQSRDDVIRLLGTLNVELGITLLVVTHDPVIAQVIPRSVTIRDGRVGAEGRRGEEFAVVGRDGTVQLPPDVLKTLPPGTLVRIRPHISGVDLRRPDLDQ